MILRLLTKFCSHTYIHRFLSSYAGIAHRFGDSILSSLYGNLLYIYVHIFSHYFKRKNFMLKVSNSTVQTFWDYKINLNILKILANYYSEKKWKNFSSRPLTRKSSSFSLLFSSFQLRNKKLVIYCLQCISLLKEEYECRWIINHIVCNRCLLQFHVHVQCITVFIDVFNNSPCFSILRYVK